MLHRDHCAAALFKLLRSENPHRANDLHRRAPWDRHREAARQEALQVLLEEITWNSD